MSWYDRFKEEQIVIHQGKGHNKFWSARWDETTGEVHIRYGRIGANGRHETKEFGSNYEATNFITKKLREKFGKGYKERYNGKKIDPAILEELSIQAAIVGTKNKCHNMQWVELLDPDNCVYKEISEERLYSPDCNPGLLILMETFKEYEGQTHFCLLFTFDKCYQISNHNTHNIVKKDSELYKITQKVEAAIGRTLS